MVALFGVYRHSDEEVHDQDADNHTHNQVVLLVDDVSSQLVLFLNDLMLGLKKLKQRTILFTLQVSFLLSLRS